MNKECTPQTEDPSHTCLFSSVSQDLGEVTKLTIEKFTDAFMVLEPKMVIMTVRRGQVNETVQWKAISVQEVRGGKRREVEVSHVPET